MGNNDFYGCDSCRTSCFVAVPVILITLLALAVGVIIGAVFATAILANIASVVVLAIVFFVLTVVWAVVRYCRCRRA